MSSSLKNRIVIYLTDYNLLYGEIDMRLTAIANALDKGELELDTNQLDHCLMFFQANCVKYWSELGVAEPSHLKVFGHLLYSLTQLRDSEGGQKMCWGTIWPPSGEAALVTCVEDARDEDFLRVFFNEYSSFVAVYEMLISAQRQRKEKLKFDPLYPPMNPRFMRSMIDYIRDWPEGSLSGERSPYDFYMIFKAMDMYGVETTYAPV